PHGERPQYNREDFSDPVEHRSSPAPQSPADLARLVMHDDFDRAHEPLPAKVGADVRFEIRRAAVRYEEADERLQPQERLLGVRNRPRDSPNAWKPTVSPLSRAS